MTRSILLLVAVLLLPSWADAACSGSGLTWSCPAGSTEAEVQSAVDSATTGAVITFAAGSYSWSSSITLSNSKGVTLICAVEAACDITIGAGQLIVLAFSGTNTNLYRISGFEWLGGATHYPITFWNYEQAANSKATNVRIDHNHFTGFDTGVRAILFGESATVGVTYGSIDHNVMTGTNNAVLAFFLSGQWASPPETAYQGTANAMYVEDNMMIFTNMADGGSGCIDTLGGSSVVIRHNTFTNCLTAAHGSIDSGGPWSTEVYNNTFITDAGGGVSLNGYRLFHHQGSGEFIAFNNVFTASSGKSGSALAMTHYRSADPTEAVYSGTRCDGTQGVDGNRSPGGTYYGYPCWRQPGRNGSAVLKPMYVWNNYWSDTAAKVDMLVEDNWASGPPYPTTHIVADRDYYNAVSKDAQTTSSAPFDGTTGMGFGTLARRPATCTTGPEAADAGNGGVGYFATDENKLYRCSATNTWTATYEPYVYPHPLVSADVTGSGSRFNRAFGVPGMRGRR